MPCQLQRQCESNTQFIKSQAKLDYPWRIPVSFFMSEEKWEKVKLSKPSRQKAVPGREQSKKSYTVTCSRPSGGTFDSSGLPAEGTLISVSNGPNFSTPCQMPAHFKYNSALFLMQCQPTCLTWIVCIRNMCMFKKCFKKGYACTVTGKDHDRQPAPFSLHISQDPLTGSGTTSDLLEWNSMKLKSGPFKHSEFVHMTQHWLTCQNLPLICADFSHGHALSSPAAHDPCPSPFLCHDCPVHWLHCCSQTQGTVRYGYGNCHLTCRTLIQKVPLLCFKKIKK